MNGQELRALRLSRALTQNALGHVLGVHACTISGWERGRFRINGLKAQAIRVRLGAEPPSWDA